MRQSTLRPLSAKITGLVLLASVVGACTGNGTLSTSTTREAVAGVPSSSTRPPSTPTTSDAGLCQPSESECIGALAPGIHTTDNLITPVTFQVPEGWSKTLDVPGSFELVPRAFPTGHVGIRPEWAIANQARCTSDPEPGLGRTVDDLVAWLTEHPGLITSTPEPVTLGGLEGQVLEVRKDPEWSGPCPGRVSLFTHLGTINDPGWWDVKDSARLRLYFLDAGNGHVVTVHVETADGASFEDLVESAAPVVESFVFAGAEAGAPPVDDGSVATNPAARGYVAMTTGRRWRPHALRRLQHSTPTRRRWESRARCVDAVYTHRRMVQHCPCSLGGDTIAYDAQSQRVLANVFFQASSREGESR